jgi:hypothetical protein
MQCSIIRSEFEGSAAACTGIPETLGAAKKRRQNPFCAAFVSRCFFHETVRSLFRHLATPSDRSSVSSRFRDGINGSAVVIRLRAVTS